MKTLKGIMVCPGIVFAPVVIQQRPLYTPPIPKRDRPDTPQAKKSEERRLEEAFIKAHAALSAQLPQLKQRVGQQSAILEARIALLNDEGLKQAVMQQLDQQGVTAETAIDLTFSEEINRIQRKQDSYLRSREEDFIQLRDQLLRALQPLANETMTPVSATESSPYILVTSELSLDTVSQLDPKQVVGVISESGSKTAHTAILLRALGIPAIFGVSEAVETLKHTKKLFLNADTNQMIPDPDVQQATLYQQLVEAYHEEEKQLETFKTKEAITTDGYKISVCANISDIASIPPAQEKGIDGIGLFRTEFVFMDRETLPTEEEQTQIYSHLLKAFPTTKVLIRTLDIGGDKPLPALKLPAESNPFLGLRAIRLCLSQPELFKTQLRAILRASIHGNCHLLLPMIASLDELHAAKSLLNEAKHELAAAHIPYQEKLPLGIMIEIPSAVFTAAELAKEVDFFSVGTNDLLQYLLAVDRTNPQIASLYTPYQPAMLLAIQHIMQAAHHAGIWVSVCGELAADAQMIPLLIGLGVDELSMSASSLLKTKREISLLSRKQAIAFVQQLVQRPLSSAVIKQQLEQFHQSLSHL